jgi:hypothetical protein
VSVSRHELYVYYRVAEPQWREAADAVVAWQHALRLAHPGLEARVLRRPEAHAGAVTLMESYVGADAVDGTTFDTQLLNGAPALQAWLIGERHVERFDTLD